MMDQDPEVVRPHVERMEDLQWNPALLAEFERQERLGIGDGHPPAPSPAPSYPHTPHAPYAPQLSTAQRHRNQADQPREHDGKYAEKSASKWQQLAPGARKVVPPTSLKRVKKPARPVSRKSQAVAPRKPARKQKPLPSKLAMLDHPLHQKVGWVVRRWFRRKKKHLRALFSWRG
jgi:hypothetical protein